MTKSKSSKSSKSSKKSLLMGGGVIGLIVGVLVLLFFLGVFDSKGTNNEPLYCKGKIRTTYCGNERNNWFQSGERESMESTQICSNYIDEAGFQCKKSADDASKPAMESWCVVDKSRGGCN